MIEPDRARQLVNRWAILDGYLWHRRTIAATPYFREKYERLLLENNRRFTETVAKEAGIRMSGGLKPWDC